MLHFSLLIDSYGEHRNGMIVITEWFTPREDWPWPLGTRTFSDNNAIRDKRLCQTAWRHLWNVDAEIKLSYDWVLEYLLDQLYSLKIVQIYHYLLRLPICSKI